jgi:hypothetical protein
MVNKYFIQLCIIIFNSLILIASPVRHFGSCDDWNRSLLKSELQEIQNEFDDWYYKYHDC